MMDRRTFSTAVLAGAAAIVSTRGVAIPASAVRARNIVFVHGLLPMVLVGLK